MNGLRAGLVVAGPTELSKLAALSRVCAHRQDVSSRIIVLGSVTPPMQRVAAEQGLNFDLSDVAESDLPAIFSEQDLACLIATGTTASECRDVWSPGMSVPPLVIVDASWMTVSGHFVTWDAMVLCTATRDDLAYLLQHHVPRHLVHLTGCALTDRRAAERIIDLVASHAWDDPMTIRRAA